MSAPKRVCIVGSGRWYAVSLFLISIDSITYAYHSGFAGSINCDSYCLQRREIFLSYRSDDVVAVTIATQHDFTLHEGQGHIVFIPVSLNHDGTDGPRIQSSRLLVIRLRLRPVRLSTQPH